MLKKIWIVIFVCSFCLVRANNLPANKIEETKNVFDLKKIKNINIVNVNGEVILEEGNKGEITLLSKKIASNPEDLKDCLVSINEQGDTLTIEAKYEKRFFKNVNVKINDSDVKVNFYLRVGGKLNSLKVKNVNGEIKSQIESEYISLKAVNGNIESEDKSNEIKLSTVNGNIDLVANGEKIETKSVNGKIQVECKRKFEGHIKSSTVNGDIIFNLYENLKFNFKGKNMNGKINSDFDFVKKEQNFVGNTKAESEIKDCPVFIKASTINGVIKVIKD